MTKRNRVLEYLACILVGAGVLLVFISSAIPPLGEIHSSALWAIGQFFALAGSLLGIKGHYDTKFESVKEELREGK
ncbi:MAG: hypothetical protein ACRCUJ_04220 [Phocaeicola sp.]